MRKIAKDISTHDDDVITKISKIYDIYITEREEDAPLVEFRKRDDYSWNGNEAVRRLIEERFRGRK